MSLAGLVSRARGLPVPAEPDRALAAPLPVTVAAFDAATWTAWLVPGERAWRCHGCAPMDWPDNWERLPEWRWITCPRPLS